MKFRKIEHTDDISRGNVYGFDNVEFKEFNYDNEGSALAIVDGTIHIFGLQDLNDFLYLCADWTPDNQCYELDK